MIKYILIFCVLIAANFVASNPVKETQNLKIKLIKSEEIKDILKEYPNAQKVLPQKTTLVQTEETANQGIVRAVDNSSYVLTEYSFGRRVIDDFKVGNDLKSENFGVPINVQSIIKYPQYGGGHILSYVNLLVKQEHKNGGVWLLSGGIGQRHMNIVVEAHGTHFYEHEASFYGF